jgi:hypothetical protein
MNIIMMSYSEELSLVRQPMAAKMVKKFYALVATEGTLWCIQGLATEFYIWSVKHTSQPHILFLLGQY